MVAQIKKTTNLYHLLEYEHHNYVVNLHSLPPINNSVEYLERVNFSIYDNDIIQL